MTLPEQRTYKINIDPRILELLGPSLYTNIYYVLAELVANAYDADASNVYIIEEEGSIIVEDDGTGMSYSEGDIERYLNVAVETRTATDNIYSASGRRKRMGRKGVGKLAALSVSENVHVLTSKNNEKSGFVLARHVGADHQLSSLPDEDIKFRKIEGDGTAIVMTSPQYGLHKTPNAIKKNLLKIFPLVDDSFKIHIFRQGKSIVVENFDKEMIKELGGLIILGERFYYLKDYFNSLLPENNNKRMIYLKPKISNKINLAKKTGGRSDYDLEIEGWIGVYRTTRGRKNDPEDFPDNFISLLSNKKLGEFNILPNVGRNRLNEVYIVGQLHVDLFEEPELPDMALSNRQGYKSDDKRYTEVISYVQGKLLPSIVDLRAVYATLKKSEANKQKQEKQKQQEIDFAKRIDSYKDTASSSAAIDIAAKVSGANIDEIKSIIHNKINEILPIVGIKRKLDSQKRKLLISHARVDKSLADLLYQMLIFNNINEVDIIYASSDNGESRIPEDTSVFDYLRNFFVESYSDEKIYVVYVTSKVMSESWFTVSEVGAGWITQSKHKIFNINGHIPQRPLNTEQLWHNSSVDNDSIHMTSVGFDDFIVKIRDVCSKINITPKSKEANIAELSRYVSIRG
ncbi:putative ATP-binding protein/HSP90-like ATPase [Desulfuromonas soudanensis]|uniref:Putative ATP-binding protein/HSP90-like ATPase n=1 Tax=Desulfuromonas soudanensis TaxID=1603606 RepID=A0A0M4CY93_9BACT|nr:ATP-binding protein [Desulfuromonas soudanensis]ALC17391.1 putative ATP-binding protein/HSP90-like ATPase [Desulfuromonas soudanensis]